MKFVSHIFGNHHDTSQDKSKYRTKIQLGRLPLRLHYFHRGDKDPAWHDHPMDFLTFPLSPYVEEVLDLTTGKAKLNRVEAGRIHFRPAEYAHRLLGRAAGKEGFEVRKGGFWTIVFEWPERRPWFFYDKGEWNGWLDWPGALAKLRRIPWRHYVAPTWNAKEHLATLLATRGPWEQTGGPRSGCSVCDSDPDLPCLPGCKAEELQAARVVAWEALGSHTANNRIIMEAMIRLTAARMAMVVALHHKRKVA